MSGQLRLLPSSPPTARRERVALARLDGFADARPSPQLLDQLRAVGLLQPIVAVPAGGGRLEIVDGRRRTKAIAELAKQGDWSEPPTADVVILTGSEAAQQPVRCGLTLALHASRSASPASELGAIESILASAGDAEEASTVKQIASQTGLSVQTVHRRLRLRSLIPGLRAAFDHARLSTTVAEAAARLPAPSQARLEQRLNEDARVTLADVRAIAREQTAAATSALPEELFVDCAVVWQVTVRGHLTAALQAIPHDEQHMALAGCIAEIAASLEEVNGSRA